MKRYQVFISSTFVDLKEERNEVMRALLELDCIPTGMELFPAADDSQWEVIKSIIDNCDYYILILAGRYGSTNNDGISYTELEYDYATKKGIPTMAFLHQNLEKLTLEKSEKSDTGKEKLLLFRTKVQSKLCKFWNAPQELGSVVSRSLIQLIKTKLAIGWVRADKIMSSESASEIIRLTKRIKELEDKHDFEPNDTEDLQQGDDLFRFKFSFTVSENADRYRLSGDSFEAICNTITWNDLFYAMSPLMINEAREYELRSSINNLLDMREKHIIEESIDNSDIYNFNILAGDFHTVIIQLRALKLITKSDKKRRIDDNDTYWTLTKYGDNLMTRMRALHRFSL